MTEELDDYDKAVHEGLEKALKAIEKALTNWEYLANITIVFEDYNLGDETLRKRFTVEEITIDKKREVTNG